MARINNRLICVNFQDKRGIIRGKKMREILMTLLVSMKRMNEEKATAMVDEFFAGTNISSSDVSEDDANIDRDEFLRRSSLSRNKEISDILARHSDKQRRNSLFD